MVTGAGPAAMVCCRVEGGRGASERSGGARSEVRERGRGSMRGGRTGDRAAARGGDEVRAAESAVELNLREKRTTTTKGKRDEVQQQRRRLPLLTSITLFANSVLLSRLQLKPRKPSQQPSASLLGNFCILYINSSCPCPHQHRVRPCTASERSATNQSVLFAQSLA